MAFTVYISCTFYTSWGDANEPAGVTLTAIPFGVELLRAHAAVRAAPPPGWVSTAKYGLGTG